MVGVVAPVPENQPEVVAGLRRGRANLAPAVSPVHVAAGHLRVKGTLPRLLFVVADPR